MKVFFQGITFPIVHNKLGEEVAAAVVLKDDHQLTEQALKEFLSKILASYKIPQTIVFFRRNTKRQNRQTSKNWFG